MSSCPILAIPDFTLPFELHCDAWGEGIGTVLMQRKHPIAFEIRKLIEVEKHYSIYDKEMLAIMHALAKFRQYLVCGKLIIQIDHNSLRFFMHQNDLNDHQQKWVSRVQAYDFNIKYMKGTSNEVADALSQQPHLNTITSISKDWRNDIVAEYAKDTQASEILEGKMPNEEYRIWDDLILYKGRIFLTPQSKIKGKIIKEFHDSPLAGHQGYYKTYKQIREMYSWKALKRDVLKHVQECIICQQNKTEQRYPAGLLQPLPIPNQKWESISMDFITGLPKVHGKDSIFVVVDRLSKYAHFFVISSNYKVSQVAELFFKEVFRLHGIPKVIVSDRDSKFLSQFWQEIFRLAGTNLTPSTSYHPQTDGRTEIVNKWLEGYLRNYVTSQQAAWIKWLHLGEYCYNTTHHMSIGMSPFKALYGYEAPSFGHLVTQESKVQSAQDFIQRNIDLMKTLRENLQQAQNQQKIYADRHWIERTFEVGDLVFLRLQPYKQTSIKKNGAEKLKPRFYGPYKVTRRVGEVAYELELLGHSKIHNVFHVSRLKRVLGQQVQPCTELPPLDEEGQLTLELEVILDTRERKLRNKIITEFLIKWKELLEDDATWEREESIKTFKDKSQDQQNSMILD